MEERYKLYKREFTKLGFDTSIREAQYFYDMIDEVRTLVNEGKNYDEILEMIPRISLEYYHFIMRFQEAILNQDYLNF